MNKVDIAAVFAIQTGAYLNVLTSN